MKNECAIAYEATKEVIRKKTKKIGIDVLFSETYPYAVRYSMEQQKTLFDEVPEAKQQKLETLHINVEVGGLTTVEISGAGRVEGMMLRKMIKAAENAADLYFRAKAEGAGSR